MSATNWDAVVIGGGLAGLSAALYLARARRSVLVLDLDRSLARWEPDVQNYLGFPEGIAGIELLRRGHEQAAHFGAQFATEKVTHVSGNVADGFTVTTELRRICAHRVLLATGLLHIPPDIPGVTECLGHSMFFCKDCDGYRVAGKRLAILGHKDDAAEYALNLLTFSPSVVVLLHGREPAWSRQHEAWLREYQVPVLPGRIHDVEHERGRVSRLHIEPDTELLVDAIFTTRGDIYHNDVARSAGAALDSAGQVLVDADMQTSVPGLYAAGCLTPANCQMIIAAGQGATAAQAISRSLFEDQLARHELCRAR